MGRSPASTSSPRRSSAWRQRNSAASAISPGSSITKSVSSGTWSRPVAGARRGAHTSAASPTFSARVSASAATEPLEIRREPLRQLRGLAAQRLAERGRSPERLEELRRGQEDGLLERPDRPLVGRVEGAERVDLVAEELDPDGQRRRRREDVDETAAPRELASARDFEDGRVAEAEELGEQRVLAESRVDHEPARLGREVVRGDRVLEEGLDARDEDPRSAAPPGAQGRDASSRLVGDELAPLIGKRGPRLEHGDRAPDLRATPGAPPRRGRRSRRRGRSRRAARRPPRSRSRRPGTTSRHAGSRSARRAAGARASRSRAARRTSSRRAS